MNKYMLHLYVGMDGVTESQRQQIRGVLSHHFQGYTETSTQGV